MSPDAEGLPRLLDNADPMILVDGSGVCRYANRAAGEALALDGVDILGRRVAVDLDGGGEPALRRAIAVTRSTGKDQHVELRHPRSGRFFEGRVVPQADAVAVYLHDVTARREREAALLQSRHELLASTAGGTTGGFSIDLRTGQATMTPEVLEIYGLDPSEGAVRTWVGVREMIHPEDRSRTAQAVTEAGGRPGTFADVTYRLVRPGTGEVRLVHEVSVVLADAQGRPSSVSGSMTDITELQAAQDALVASERRLSRTLEAIGAVVCTMEHTGAPVIANAGVQEILGWRPDELTTLESWDGLIHPDDLPTCLPAWQRIGEFWNLRYRMRHKDGHWVWLADRGRWIERDDGLGNGLFAIAIDISSSVAEEEALRASEAHFRAVSDTAPDAILTIASTGVIVGCNPAAERMFGVPTAALVGSNVLDLMPDDVRAGHPPVIDRLFREGASRSRIVRAAQGRRADGSTFPMEVAVATWTAEDGDFATAIIRDQSSPDT